MKNKIAIPDFLPVLKEEDIRAAALRRENYALARDLRAAENNEAIVRRLAKTRNSEG